jgi:hypothetical protein
MSRQRQPVPPVNTRDRDSTLAANREGIDVYIDVARNLDPDRWNQPVAPGGWSPAQITDHLTRVYDFGTAVIAGTLTGRPLPAPLRWLLGRFWFLPAVRSGRFSRKAKAPKFFQPASDPRPSDELLPRLRAASERFAAAVESAWGRDQDMVAHPMFGTISLHDFLELQVIHVKHHRGQLPTVSS